VIAPITLRNYPRRSGLRDPVEGEHRFPRAEKKFPHTLPRAIDRCQSFRRINCVRSYRTFEKVTCRVEAVRVPQRWPLKAFCCSGLRTTAISMEPVACRPKAPSLLLAVNSFLFGGVPRCS
jgi:hypothetical protein